MLSRNFQEYVISVGCPTPRQNSSTVWPSSTVTGLSFRTVGFTSSNPLTENQIINFLNLVVQTNFIDDSPEINIKIYPLLQFLRWMLKNLTKIKLWFDRIWFRAQKWKYRILKISAFQKSWIIWFLGFQSSILSLLRPKSKFCQFKSLVYAPRTQLPSFKNQASIKHKFLANCD